MIFGYARVSTTDQNLDAFGRTVSRGLEHRTGSDEECEVMIFEPSEVVNTGDAPTSEFDADTLLGTITGLIAD